MEFLGETPEGGMLVEKLVILARNGQAYAFVGPDLDSVTQATCTTTRCEESCTPAYERNLDHFGAVDPLEDEVTCTDQCSDDAKPIPASEHRSLVSSRA